MKILPYGFIILFIVACHKPPVVTQATPYSGPGILLNTDTKIIPLSDLNNDKVIDTAFVTGPKSLHDEGYDCRDNKCNIDITFSGGQPKLHFDNAVSAAIENIGDIDKDGFCEILISPSWWVGCHGHIHVYSYKNNAWKYYGYADNNVCGRDKLSEFITKTEGNAISLEELMWDAVLEDYHEVPKTFIIE